MATAKKTANSRKFKPDEGHKTSFQLVPETQGSIDAFGKIVDPAPISDLPPGQHLAIIFGVRDQGTCIRLPLPQHVTLGAPDGPADGCGFDPAEFVVWRNLPRNQVVTHLSARTTSLHEALMPAGVSASLNATPTLDDVLHKWLPRAPQGQQIPIQDQLAAAWAAFGSGGQFSIQAAQILANLINRFIFNSPVVQAQSLSGTMTVLALRTALHLSA